MSVLLYFLTLSAVFTTATLGIVWYAGRESRSAVRRLAYMTRKRSQTSQDLSSRQQGEQRQQDKTALLTTKLQVLRGRLNLSSSWMAVVQGRLASAGFREANALDVYLLTRAGAPVCAALLVALVSHDRGLGAVSAFALFYLLPDLILRRMAKARRHRIQRSLPDAVDLLVICVDAGLGLDQALVRVSQELGVSHPDLTLEFKLVGLEQRAGKPRLQAWQAMAERVNLPELQSFVNMLMQTERFGTPIAKALSTFASGLRERRNQQAEELAAKTTIKIIFPLIFCILPSMFIVLLGPAMITLFRNLPMLGK